MLITKVIIKFDKMPKNQKKNDGSKLFFFKEENILYEAPIRLGQYNKFVKKMVNTWFWYARLTASIEKLHGNKIFLKDPRIQVFQKKV